MQATALMSALHNVEYYGQPLEGDITALVNDTRQVIPNSCFIAIKGEGFDGHVAAQEVYEKGARMMVVEHLPHNWQSIPLIYAKVDSTTRAQAILANSFYDCPSEKMNVVAVTGTNGKTTTSTLISQALMALGHKTGVVGTLHYKVDQLYHKAPNTTPNSLVLQQLFSQMVEAGCSDAIIEASSHGLQIGRLSYTNIDCAIFTNLTREHLDFHKTMAEYAQAKMLLFAQLGQRFHRGKSSLAILNIDDKHATMMKEATSADVVTYSIEKEATAYATNIVATAYGQSFTLHFRNHTYSVSLPMFGKYNVSNYLAVFLCLVFYYGYSPEAVLEVTSSLEGVEGRMQVVSQGQPFDVVVDFAHTPDAVKNVLVSLKEHTKGRLITVIGHSGGNRDSGARPEIGDYVFGYSDEIVLTADNPRHESIYKICREIVGIHTDRSYIIIEDRNDAVEYALSLAKAGDTVLFAGKGGEKYQIIGDEQLPYDEVAVIRTVLTKLLEQ